MSNPHPAETSAAGPIAFGRVRGRVLAFGITTLLAGLIALPAEENGIATPVLLAVPTIAAGVAVSRSPVEPAAVLPLVLGLFWTASGIIGTFRALIGREVMSRGWAVASGVLGLVADIAIGRAMHVRPRAAPSIPRAGPAPA